MDASLSTLTNCEWVVQTGRRLIKSEVLHLFMLNCAGQQNRRTPRNSLKNSSSGRFGPNTHPSNPSRVVVSLSSQETVSVHKLHREDNKPQRPEWVLTTHTHTHTHSDHRWKRVVVMGCLVLPENLKILSLGRNNIKSFAGLVSHTGHWGVLGTWVRQIMHGHKLRRMMTELLPGLKFPSTLDLTNHEHPCKMFSFIFSYLCHKKNITTRNSVFIPTLLTWQHVDLKPTTQVQQIQDVCLWSGFT